MFSDDQMKKIAFFSSLTKVTNECFEKCVNFKIEEIDKNIKCSLSKEESLCLNKCSTEYLKLREFVEDQLNEDWNSIKNKNKKILEDET